MKLSFSTSQVKMYFCLLLKTHHFRCLLFPFCFFTCRSRPPGLGPSSAGELCLFRETEGVSPVISGRARGFHSRPVLFLLAPFCSRRLLPVLAELPQPRAHPVAAHPLGLDPMAHISALSFLSGSAVSPTPLRQTAPAPPLPPGAPPSGALTPARSDAGPPHLFPVPGMFPVPDPPRSHPHSPRDHRRAALRRLSGWRRFGDTYHLIRTGGGVGQAQLTGLRGPPPGPGCSLLLPARVAPSSAVRVPPITTTVTSSTSLARSPARPSQSAPSRAQHLIQRQPDLRQVLFCSPAHPSPPRCPSDSVPAPAPSCSVPGGAADRVGRAGKHRGPLPREQPEQDAVIRVRGAPWFCWVTQNLFKEFRIEYPFSPRPCLYRGRVVSSGPFLVGCGETVRSPGTARGKLVGVVDVCGIRADKGLNYFT